MREWEGRSRGEVDGERGDEESYNDLRRRRLRSYTKQISHGLLESPRLSGQLSTGLPSSLCVDKGRSPCREIPITCSPASAENTAALIFLLAHQRGLQ